MKNLTYEDYEKSADFILSKIDFKPEIGIVLGSALGTLANMIEDKVEIDYTEIPNFLESTVESHAGKLILGKLSGKNVCLMSGRFHYYEGYDFEDLALPMRVMKLMGVKSVILTNAAGGVNRAYDVGDIMIIKDYINFSALSPVRGKNDERFGNRFFDMTEAYDREYIKIAEKIAKKHNIPVRKGIYFYMSGPQFETPAEIKAIRILGGDAVGMSTVTETITARHMEMRVLGLSLITNMAAGVNTSNLTTEEVDETGKEASERFQKLIKKIVKKM